MLKGIIVMVISIYPLTLILFSWNEMLEKGFSLSYCITGAIGAVVLALVLFSWNEMFEKGISFYARFHRLAVARISLRVVGIKSLLEIQVADAERYAQFYELFASLNDLEVEAIQDILRKQRMRLFIYVEFAFDELFASLPDLEAEAMREMIRTWKERTSNVRVVVVYKLFASLSNLKVEAIRDLAREWRERADRSSNAHTAYIAE